MPETPTTQLTPEGPQATQAPAPSLSAPAVPVPPAPAARAGLMDWLFGAWMTGGSRPISKSVSFRWAAIGALVSGGAWAYSSTIADAPAWLENAAPAVTRITLSFAVAFLAGFVVRKVLKAVFIAGLLLAGLFFAAKLAGVKLDLSLLKSTTEQALDGTKSLAQRLGEVTKHYMPSTLAASIGLWRGGTRDSIK